MTSLDPMIFTHSIITGFHLGFGTQAPVMSGGSGGKVNRNRSNSYRQKSYRNDIIYKILVGMRLC